MWNIPFRRNPFFTGREPIFIQIEHLLHTGKTAALSQPPALSGLGGIGKTQTAVEYAYRSRDAYQYVLSVQANTQETLISDFVALAKPLNLPEKDAQEQHIIVQDAPLDGASTTERALAIDIVRAMDGLPLALDQAGAYIEETNESLSNYLTLYRTQRAHLLKHRGGLVPHHPDSVATTWSLAFANIARVNPAAIELMRFCAFLAPDGIPEELITEGHHP